MRRRLPIAALALSAILRGEEDVVVGWDPPQYGILDWGWEAWLLGLGVCLAGYGCWRALMYFLESRLERLNWAAFRRWIPSVMLALGWLLFCIARLTPDLLENSWGFALLLLFGCLDFPFFIALALSHVSLEGLPAWLQILAGSAG